MKRKVYFQISIILYIFLSIILAIFAAAVYAIIWMLKDGLGTATVWEWAGFAAAIFAIGYMGYTIIRMAKNRIILTDKEIYVPDHWGSKDYKIQYETHIAYSEILDIFITPMDPVGFFSVIALPLKISATSFNGIFRTDEF